MREPRLYLAGVYATGDSLELPRDSAHYMTQVLRLEAGRQLRLFNGLGLEFVATLQSIDRRQATVRVGASLPTLDESPLSIHLAQCVSKGERMDLVMQKCVELGVNRITPVLSSRSVVRMSDERWQKRWLHWQGIVVAACEQSGRSMLPHLDSPVSLDAWLAARPSSETALVLDPAQGLRMRDLPSDIRELQLLVGPEGGLDELEIQQASQAGMRALSLGTRILRTETAAIAACAMAQAAWGDL